MLIDWFTVGAQTLNFLILVFLLKRFLYQPILQAIDAREQRIAAALADANGKQAAAQQERDAYRHKNEDFERQRADLLGKAMEDAKREHQRLLDAARVAADALSIKRQESLQSEARTLHEALRRRTQQEVFAISRKALADLASASLEERAVAVFIRRLRDLAGQPKAELALALGSGAAPAVLKSAFALPDAQRAAVQAALNETFSADIPLRFETVPEQVCGIELSASGRKVAWSVAGYLGSLEKGIAELLDKPAPSVPQPVPADDHAA